MFLICLLVIRVFVIFVLSNEMKMKIDRRGNAFLIIMFLTVFVLFLSYRYVVQVNNGQIQKTSYLFYQSVEQEKVLMQPGQLFLGEPEAQSDSVIIETEKEKVVYKKNKKADSLALIHKREWFFQTYLAYKNPNRAFMLDSLFQDELKREGIVAQTAVCFLQGDSLMSCSNELLCQTGIALEPVVFGVDGDPRRIELQAYILFSPSYLISQMPLLWGLILLWCIPVVFIYVWLRRKKKDDVVVVPHLMGATEVEELTSGIFFDEKTGELRKRDHVIYLKKNRLHTFISLLRAPNHSLSYGELCQEVLERPLRMDESVDDNRDWNQSTKKTMGQTIQRLRKDLEEFPELSIDNIPNSGYRLNIKAVLSESEMQSIFGGCCSRSPFDEKREMQFLQNVNR